jgi:hypothetical protein
MYSATATWAATDPPIIAMIGVSSISAIDRTYSATVHPTDR